MGFNLGGMTWSERHLGGPCGCPRLEWEVGMFRCFCGGPTLAPTPHMAPPRDLKWPCAPTRLVPDHAGLWGRGDPMPLRSCPV